MLLYSPQELLFSVSVAAFVAVSLTIAAVRWGHKCEPYVRHMDYYFPAWKVIVFCFMTSLVLVPAAVLPKEEDSVLLVRQMLILSSPLYCALIMFSYFGKVLRKEWWRRPFFWSAILFETLILTSIVLALIPGTQLVGTFCKVIFSITGVFALLCIVWCLLAFIMIVRAMVHVAEENYSNPEDFPHNYARHVLWIPVVHISISWVISYIGDPVVIALGMFVLSGVNVAFLIGALSPHRAKDIQRWEERSSATMPAPALQAENDRISPELKEDLLRTIRHFVEDQSAYLDSHLSLADLSRNCGANRSYVSLVMRERLGGFYNYINRCRMDYASRYRSENPNASIEEVAEASGFGSRQSYYNVRRQLGQ